MKNIRSKKCLRCKKKISGHPNRKRCKPCAKELVVRPQSSLTKTQRAEAKEMIGKMDRKDIALNLGTSLSNLKRAFRGTSLSFYNYCTINPKLVRDVNKYYETHTLVDTAKRFGLREKQIDHIVYRYKLHKPKQLRWTDAEIIELARMAGLVSPKAQAKFFNRPRANEGSIKSVWAKKFSTGRMCSVNGMTHWTAKALVNQKARYLRPKGISRKGKLGEFRKVILWVDMERCLKKEVPDFLKETVSTMADFQRWLHKSKDPKPKILKMIKEREICS